MVYRNFNTGEMITLEEYDKLDIKLKQEFYKYYPSTN